MIQLVCRFVGAAADFATRAEPALALLAVQPTCQSVRLARSTEDSGNWVLTAEFPTFAGYRAALSPFDVRITVIPFLSEADQLTSGVFEVALFGAGGTLTQLDTVVDPAQIWSGTSGTAG